MKFRKKRKDKNVAASLSKYDELVQEVRAKINVHAKDCIPKLYRALRKEGVMPEDAKARIEKDFTNVWTKKTILENLPDEAKNPVKQAARKGKKSVNVALTENLVEKPVPVAVVLTTDGHSQPMPAAGLPGDDEPSKDEVDYLFTIDRKRAAAMVNEWPRAATKAWLKADAGEVVDVFYKRDDGHNGATRRA